MKTSYLAGMRWVSFIILSGLFSCNRVASTNYTNTHTHVSARSDSMVYMITVDSISIPVNLKEMGDFPVYSKNVPYRFITSGHTVNFKDLKYLHFLNGQMITGRQRDRVLRKLKEEDIERIKYIPVEEATQDYGQKAAHGIILIETKGKK